MNFIMKGELDEETVPDKTSDIHAYISCLEKHFLNRENEKTEREMERKIKRER